MQARRLEPEIFIKGIDVIINLDLGKHRELLIQTQAELLSYDQAVEHESQRKRHYYRLIGGDKYDDDSLKKSVDDIKINIRHLSDKAKLARDKIAHHTLIIDTLAKQLQEYNEKYASANRQL
jgi:hypothetical protein